MRRDLGAAIPANDRTPFARIIGFALMYLGALSAALGALMLLLVMLGGV